MSDTWEWGKAGIAVEYKTSRSALSFLSSSQQLTMKAFVAAALFAGSALAATPACHCLPEDSCWPTTSQWDALNSTVGGQLIATVPIGSPCHEPSYDATACEALQDDWNRPQTQYGQSDPLQVAELIAQLHVVVLGDAAVLYQSQLRSVH